MILELSGGHWVGNFPIFVVQGAYEGRGHKPNIFSDYVLPDR